MLSSPYQIPLNSIKSCCIAYNGLLATWEACTLSGVCRRFYNDWTTVETVCVIILQSSGGGIVFFRLFHVTNGCENERSDGCCRLTDHGLRRGRQRCRMVGLLSVDVVVWIVVDGCCGDARRWRRRHEVVRARGLVCSVGRVENVDDARLIEVHKADRLIVMAARRQRPLRCGFMVVDGRHRPWTLSGDVDSPRCSGTVRRRLRPAVISLQWRHCSTLRGRGGRPWRCRLLSPTRTVMHVPCSTINIERQFCQYTEAQPGNLSDRVMYNGLMDLL